MLNTGHDLPLCRVVRSQLIGDHHPRRATLALQQFAHQMPGRLGISAALHKNLQDETVLIHSAPQSMRLVTDQNIGESSPKFLRSQPDCFMGDNDPTSRQQVLNHPKAERKPEIEPNGVSNDFSGKVMAAIYGITVYHRPSDCCFSLS